MPGRDGTGPLGMGPCGKNGCECRKRLEKGKKVLSVDKSRPEHRTR
ncbi:MAG TPA: DUF5320 domain-containing protein [Methanocella sp.]